MHLKYIIICAVLFFAIVVIYSNIDTEAEIDSQLVRVDTFDTKEKLEPMIHEVHIAPQIPIRESIQTNVEKLVELNGSFDYIEVELECESFFKVGEKKTCIAQYSDKEEGDTVYLEDKPLKRNASKIELLPLSNTPPASVVAEGDLFKIEQMYNEKLLESHELN